MKGLHFFVFVAFVQVCFSAPYVKRETESSALTDSEIDKIRRELKTIPGVDPNVIDRFADIFYNFRENSTDDEIFNGTINLISLAVNVDASKLNKTFFAESSSSEESDENQLHSGETNKLTDGGITEGELKDIEHALLKELTPTQVKQAMIIFQGLREGASAKETEDALFDLFVSAIYGALVMPAKSQNEQIIGDENVIIYPLNENQI